jgi:hypothetical protein
LEAAQRFLDPRTTEEAEIDLIRAVANSRISVGTPWRPSVRCWVSPSVGSGTRKEITADRLAHLAGRLLLPAHLLGRRWAADHGAAAIGRPETRILSIEANRKNEAIPEHFKPAPP